MNTQNHKKRKYIFVTMGIAIAGGVQCYVAAKARYLESQNWDVYVFSAFDKNVKSCVNPLLNKYMGHRIKGMYMQPYMFPNFIVEKTINRMLEIVGRVNKDDEIIIESHDSHTCPWGELLAEKLQGKHYFYTMNEKYRQPGQTYLQQMDLYLFKSYRKEILGSVSTISRLLDGFRNVTIDDIPGENILDEAPVQDVDSPKINEISRLDWNICYIGRTCKPYVPNIFKGVGEFASRYPEKKIHFLIVGELENESIELNNIREKNSNLVVTELGFLHPIPRSLYDKVDVVIAGSGCARHSAEEGKLVIVADAETKEADGLLGYDTMSSIYRDSESVCTSFADALERALVEKVWEKMINRFPKKKDISESINYQFYLYSKSDHKKEYFDRNKLLKGKINWKRMFIHYIKQEYPNVLKVLEKIKAKFG